MSSIVSDNWNRSLSTRSPSPLGYWVVELGALPVSRRGSYAPLKRVSIPNPARDSKLSSRGGTTRGSQCRVVIPRRNDEGSQCRVVIPRRNDEGSQCRVVIPRRNDEGSQCRVVIPRRNDE